LLREVKFDLKQLLTYEEFEHEGSNLVRERFIQAFEKDELDEPLHSIKERMEKVLGQIENCQKVLI